MYHSEKLFSLIIPVYNVAPYLKRCLNSCLDQNFNKFEIVCIDDGSTDESGIILDKYQKDYKERIKVIHTKNNGVSEARNCGIMNSAGQYCWFIDPDDVIERNILDDLSKELYESDIVLLPFAEIDEQKGTRLHKTWRLSENEYLNDFAEVTTSNKFDKVWNYIIRKSVLTDNDLKFGKGIILGEDRAFDFFLKQCIRKWIVYDKISYYYYIREQSASKGHIHDDNYYKKMIENAYCTAGYYNAMRKKCIDREYDKQAQQQQNENVRYVISNSVKYGDVALLKYYIKNLKALNLYPFSVQHTNDQGHITKNCMCFLFNKPVIAETICRLFGIKKRLSQ